MTVRLSPDGVVLLEGACPIEDAEPLQRLLLAAHATTLDWRACTAAHTGVIQVLLAAKPALIGPPDDAFLAKWISPILQRAAAGAGESPE